MTIDGYYVCSKNNPELVRKQLDSLNFIRYDTLPMGGVKFNWISRYCEIDWNTFDSKFQILNHIDNEKQFSNKGLLLTNLRNYQMNTKKSKSIPMKSFIPETYLLDNTNDRMAFKRRFQADSIWICKPVGLSCGREIFIFRSEEQLERLLKEYHGNNRYCTLYYNRLVQKYIENPLLINKHKFDIRTYLLCICTSKEVLCFAAQTGYLRLSMYEFDLANTTNRFIHLTNQSIQIKDKEFSSMKNQTGMTMEEFNLYINEFIQPKNDGMEKDWVRDRLPKKINEILSQVADSVKEKLVIREGCFGFYGVDILIDEKLNCWLLEINSGPTLDMTNAALEKVIPLCLNEAIKLVIESLDNYRSLGSVFPLRQSDLYTYLPLSNNHPISPSTIPIFTSFNPHRIDLTPGVLIPSHRSRRRSSSYQRYAKPIPSKIKSISQRSKSVQNERQSTKMSRVHLSRQLTEIIENNHLPTGEFCTGL